MQTLVEELKLLLIDSLKLEDLSPADIDPEAPLFNEGLGLDSIDALELGIALQSRYGIHLSPDAATTREYFRSVNSLARLVAEQRSR